MSRDDSRSLDDIRQLYEGRSLIWGSREVGKERRHIRFSGIVNETETSAVARRACSVGDPFIFTAMPGWMLRGMFSFGTSGCAYTCTRMHAHRIVRAYLYNGQSPNFIGVRNKCDDSRGVRYHSQLARRKLRGSMTKSNVPSRGKRRLRIIAYTDNEVRSCS